VTFEIDVAGRTRSVAVERIKGSQQFRVTVDGRVHRVDAVRVGSFGLSLLVDGDGAASREITVTPAGGRGEFLIGLDGRSVPASINARRTGRASADAGGHAHGEQRVAAPMPGRVVRVLVAPGDEVSARQGVVVVEAMKMENELRSPKAGRIKEVSVSPGMSVEAGRVLVVVE
jgi:acetyl/propionyl-CoA carboxylase alpha subunit